MSQEFDLLKQWGELDDVELGRIANSDNIAVLERVARLLTDETTRENKGIEPAKFASLVREMLTRYRDGAWQLGEAIIEAGDLADRKAYAEAQKVYENFLGKCRWKFYRDIARTQLQKLGRQNR